jgi:hypothetical protein
LKTYCAASGCLVEPGNLLTARAALAGREIMDYSPGAGIWGKP